MKINRSLIEHFYVVYPMQVIYPMELDKSSMAMDKASMAQRKNQL